MPDESVVSGRIEEIGDIAVWPQGNQSGNPLLELSGTINGDIDLHQWTGAVVTVSITRTLAEGVLAVPVPSLLALLGGGYAIEVIDGESTRLVAIETGVHDDGWVEIKGTGLEVGTEIMVPR